MNPTDLPMASTPPSPEIYPRPKDETKKLSFWVSQIFIIIATVLGVYLASSQGFKQALAYGEIQSARSNYYLRQSLKNEIVDNIAILEEYRKGLTSGAPSARQASLNLDTFVSECLKNSGNTMETPSFLLRESRKFYRDVTEIHGKIASSTFAPAYGNQQFQAVVDHMQKDVLPEFDKDLAELRNTLKRNGIEVK